MHMSPIISPSGDPVFTAGHAQSWKQATYRGFNVSLEWTGEGRNIKPCLCIWADSLVTITGSTPGIWAIMRTAMTEFMGFTKELKCTGSLSQYGMAQCMEALPMLGKDANDKQAFLALCDVIVKFGPELVLMPVAPRSIKEQLAGQKFWEVSATNKDTGKVLSEAEV